MNLNELITTEEAKISLINGLARIARADLVIHEKEYEFFKNITLALGVNSIDVDKLLDITVDIELPVVFLSDEEKMFFLTQAVQLCEIDGDYAIEEQREIRKICEEMNISEDALVKVEEWVKEGVLWNRRGEELLKLH